MKVSTTDSNVLWWVEMSGSVSPTKVHSRVGCERLRHSAHRVPVRATPEKQMEYKEGLTFDRWWFPVMKACCRNAASYVTQATPPKS